MLRTEPVRKIAEFGSVARLTYKLQGRPDSQAIRQLNKQLRAEPPSPPIIASHLLSHIGFNIVREPTLAESMNFKMLGFAD